MVRPARLAGSSEGFHGTEPDRTGQSFKRERSWSKRIRVSSRFRPRIPNLFRQRRRQADHLARRRHQGKTAAGYRKRDLELAGLWSEKRAERKGELNGTDPRFSRNGRSADSPRPEI